MAKLDRLGWAEGLCVDTYGLRVGIRVNRAGALDELEARLPPDWQPAPAPEVDRLFSLILGGGDARVRRYNLVYAGIAPSRRYAYFTTVGMSVVQLPNPIGAVAPLC